MSIDAAPLLFNAFVMNTPSHVAHGLWRLPEAQNHEIDSLTHWTDLARNVEAAGFDLLFFADVVGLRAPWNGTFDLAVEEGIQIPVNDPSVLMTALAAVTTRLGLVFTSSIAQSLPFDFARRVSSLDHYTGGRIGWNIVTSFSDNVYRNFGYERLLEHDERYRLAEEYVDVLYKLWEGSWDDDALEQDKEGVYADPTKIHAIDHVSEHYSVAGPHLVAPSPQRTPLLFQAGASPAGQSFSARHAEGVFISSPTPEAARRLIDETRTIARRNGREPRDVNFFQGLSFVVGATPDEARAKAAYYDEHTSLEGLALHALGDAGVDAGGLPLDTPLSELGEFRGVQGARRWAAEASGHDEPTIRDLATVFLTASRIVGTAHEIADRLEEWRDAGVTGVNVTHNTRPGTFVELGRELLPTLRERGLARPLDQDARGRTLRHLLSGRDRLPDAHPAARYRGAFGATSLHEPAPSTASASASAAVGSTL